MLTDRIQKFFSLGFASQAQPADVPLMLGKGRRTQRLEILWEVSAWLSVSCGICLRKAIAPSDLTWNGSRLTLGTFLASAVIALATFPPFMKWLNIRRPKVSLEHFATPFAFGFFLDLAAVSAFRIAPKIF